MDNACCQLAVTATNPRSNDAIFAFARDLASHASSAGAIVAAAEADPDAALANAYAAAALLTMMTRDGHQKATKPLARALRLFDQCNDREQQVIAAVTAWHCGDEARAVRILRGVVESWPHDLAALKLCQILEIGLGDVRGMLRTSGMGAAVDGRSPYALSLHAFALEQAGETDLAMRFARRAIDLNPGKDPWAEHVIAHVYEAWEQPVEGRCFLHAHASGWDRCSSFMLTHNWWHLALFELKLGNPSSALNLLRTRIWGVRKKHCQDQINAISLLARIEMAGVEAAELWDDFAVHVEDHFADNMSDFLDLHYLYTLAKAGRESKVLAMLERFDPQSLPGALAHGIAAYAKREYLSAASMIAPFRRDLSAIGGSNVQQQLFELVFLDSARRICNASEKLGSDMAEARFDVAA